MTFLGAAQEVDYQRARIIQLERAIRQVIDTPPTPGAEQWKSRVAGTLHEALCANPIPPRIIEASWQGENEGYWHD